MKQLSTKVCVIGAGPSGAVTSLLLAKKNIASILIDKETFPREKACGDIVGGNVLRIFNEIDSDFLTNFPKSEHSNAIKGINLFSTDNHSLKIDFINLDNSEHVSSSY